MKLSRRAFLISGSALALALSGFAVFQSKGEEEVVRRVLEKHLPGITIPTQEVRLYHRDLEEFASDRFLKTLQLVATLWFAYPLLSLPIARRARDKFEHRLVVDFLLSTDFFRKPSVRGGSELVQYTGFHKRQLACSNPFAVLY